MNVEAITTPLCTPIRTNGSVCQSPALKGEPLCFFHNKLRVTHRRPPTVEPLTSFRQETPTGLERAPGGPPGATPRAYPHQNEIEFPPLEDAESVQLATSMLFQAIATGQIYFKRARLLLYTLKIGAINQRALAQSRAADAAAAAPPIQPRPAAPSAASQPAPHPPQPTPDVPASDVPVSEIPASDFPVSEIGRDFSPGITGAESKRALAPGTRLSPPSAQDPPFSAPSAAPSAASQPTPDVPASDVPVSEIPASDFPVSEIPVSDVPVSDVPASDVPVSEIGRDFSPGITGAESKRALAPGTRFSPPSAQDPPFSAPPAALSVASRPAVPVPCSLIPVPCSLPCSP